MNNPQLLASLLLVPFTTGLIVFALRWASARMKLLAQLIHFVGISAFLAVSGLVIKAIIDNGTVIGGILFRLDSLGAVFLAIISGVGFLTGICFIGYANHQMENGHGSYREHCTWFALFNLFLGAMALVTIAENMILTWAAIEATTIASTLLICRQKKTSSLEAAWKYAIVCSVGVAFGLFGAILLFANSSQLGTPSSHTGNWTHILANAHLMDPALAAIAFVFAFIGFGTKAGIFPMHTWLPDAYNEAPAPIGGLLSSALSNCAFFVLIRYFTVVSNAMGTFWPQTVLLIFGILSIGCGAFFMIVQRDIKRLLAYSSIENIGIVALAFGIGGPFGIAAGLLHAINNSIAKAMAFCVTGNIEQSLGTQDSTSIKGVMNLMPATGVFFGISMLALAGLPPFNVFVSEFLVITAGISSGKHWLTVLAMLLLVTAFAGLVRTTSSVLLGNTSGKNGKKSSGFFQILPLGIFVIAILIMGLRIPRPVHHLISNATAVVTNTSQVQKDKSETDRLLQITWMEKEKVPDPIPSAMTPPISTNR